MEWKGRGGYGKGGMGKGWMRDGPDGREQKRRKGRGEKNIALSNRLNSGYG